MIAVDTPFVYQDEGTAWFEDVKRGLLADEPGLGKSMQALRAARGRTLIIAPAMMFETGDWQAEIDRWDRRRLDITTTTYGQICRRIPDSKGRMTKSIGTPRPEFKGPWDTVIVDEAHYLKGRDTNWTEAIQAIRTDRLFLLTGTPIPNWSHEIFSLLRTIFPGDRRFGNYRNWLDRWFDTKPAMFGGPFAIEVLGLAKYRIPSCDCQPDLPRACGRCWVEFRRANSIDTHMLRRTWPEVGVQLPPKIERTISVPMTQAQARLYKDLKKSYLATVPETGMEISAWSTGGLHTKLSRLTTGIETLDRNYEGNGSGKLTKLLEILREREGSGVLIFTQYRRSAELAMEYALYAKRRPGLIMGGVTGRGAIKRAFQDGEIDTLIGTIGSMSESIQLQRANTVIFLEHSWRPTQNDQAIRRAYRMGQTQNVHVIHLVTKGTVDERMQAVLAEKTDEQMQMLTAREFSALL